MLTRLSPILCLWDFFQTLKAANSAVLGRIWLNLVRDIIDVPVICKYEEDPIKKEGAKSANKIILHFFHTLKGN